MAKLKAEKQAKEEEEEAVKEEADKEDDDDEKVEVEGKAATCNGEKYSVGDFVYAPLPGSEEADAKRIFRIENIYTSKSSGKLVRRSNINYSLRTHSIE